MINCGRFLIFLIFLVFITNLSFAEDSPQKPGQFPQWMDQVNFNELRQNHFAIPDFGYDKEQESAPGKTPSKPKLNFIPPKPPNFPKFQNQVSEWKRSSNGSEGTHIKRVGGASFSSQLVFPASLVEGIFGPASTTSGKIPSRFYRPSRPSSLYLERKNQAK
ncbi:hypothetical protein HYY75_07115 [bacterium]|nr:hypothetical protein [bacterium]